MKYIALRSLLFIFDLRVIVGIGGIILSVIMHELFHVFMHMGDIQDINVFPDSHAIVEVLFIPTTDYDLVIEEAMAYGVTMITLILTAMLIGDIHDARDERSIQQIIDKDFDKHFPGIHEQHSLEYLSRILKVGTRTRQPAKKVAKK